VKFTEQGSVELEVTESEREGVVSFHVIDTGPGIKAADLGRIFDPFVQIQSRQGKPHGTGLGLAVSRELARLLGGDLMVTSELGVGSRFTTVIPR
jgi:two-component system aerobic respiration control sensor histidine kinase ArcB